MADRYDEKMFLGYVEGDLEVQDKQRFEQLMVQDPKLRTLIAQVLDDRQQLRDLHAEDPPVDFMDRVNQRLERNMLLDVPPPALNPVTPQRRLRLGRAIAFTGLAAMVLLSTMVVLHTLVNQDLYDPLVSPTDGSDSAVPVRPAASADTSIVKQVAGGSPRSGPAGAVGLQPDVLESTSQRFDSSLGPDRSKLSDVSDSMTQEVPPPGLGGTLSLTDGHRQSEVESESRTAGGTTDSPVADQPQAFVRLTAVPNKGVSGLSSPGPLAEKIRKHMAKVQSPALTVGDGEDAPSAVSPGSEVGEPVHRVGDHKPLGPMAMSIQVYTTDSESAQHAVLTWAVAHQVEIVSLASDSQADHRSRQPSGQPEDRARSGGHRRVKVATTAGRMSELLKQLNQPVDQSADVLPQSPPSDPRQFFSQKSNLQPTLRPLEELDWSQLLATHAPLRPVVSHYPPDTELILTLRIDEHPAGIDQDDGPTPF